MHKPRLDNKDSLFITYNNNFLLTSDLECEIVEERVTGGVDRVPSSAAFIGSKGAQLKLAANRGIEGFHLLPLNCKKEITKILRTL